MALFEIKKIKRDTVFGVIRIVAILGMFAVFFGTFGYLDKKAFDKELQYSFYGEVQDVTYDIKGIPKVTIDQETYYLGMPGWKFDYKIQPGDSLEKRKNMLTVKLIKAKTGEVIIFERL